MLILEIIGIILSVIVVAVIFYCLYRIYKLKKMEDMKLVLAGLVIVLLIPSGIFIGLFFYKPITGPFFLQALFLAGLFLLVRLQEWMVESIVPYVEKRCMVHPGLVRGVLIAELIGLRKGDIKGYNFKIQKLYFQFLFLFQNLYKTGSNLVRPSDERELPRRRFFYVVGQCL